MLLVRTVALVALLAFVLAATASDMPPWLFVAAVSIGLGYVGFDWLRSIAQDREGEPAAWRYRDRR